MDLPKRKPNRLKEYDYSKNGAYFVTICTQNKEKLLWNPGTDNIVNLSNCGKIIDLVINDISTYYPTIFVDTYVIMPNHVHLILLIQNDEGLLLTPTISRIVGQMKRVASKQTGKSIWQRSYHDRIIRNQQEYEKIWQYIDTNPLKWEEDCFYVK